jgi:hypothetical protein
MAFPPACTKARAVARRATEQQLLAETLIEQISMGFTGA